MTVNKSVEKDDEEEQGLERVERLLRLAKGCSAASAAQALIPSPTKQRQQRIVESTRTANAAFRWSGPDVTTPIRAVATS